MDYQTALHVPTFQQLSVSLYTNVNDQHSCWIPSLVSQPTSSCGSGLA